MEECILQSHVRCADLLTAVVRLGVPGQKMVSIIRGSSLSHAEN